MSINERRINAIAEYLTGRPNGVQKSEIRANFPELFNASNTHPDMSKALNVMRENGWTEEENRRHVKLSAKGRKHFTGKPDGTREAAPVPAITEPAQPRMPEVKTRRTSVTRVLESLPAVQSAYVEMALCAIVARYHMTERKNFHPSFMAIGETGTGKTSLALIVCRMLGLDETQHVHFLARKARGELGGRRIRTTVGWIYDSPEEMGLPFVVFDEYDKATEAQRNAANPYFQGSTVLRAERQEYDVRPVAMLIANPPATGERYAVLRPEYRRRSVIVDTQFMRERRTEVETFISEAYRLTEVPVIGMADVIPPVTQTSEEARTILRAVPELLTDEGREEYPGTPFVETLVFGYCGLHGTNNVARAAHAVGLAYLRTAETVGHVRNGAVQAFSELSDVSDTQAWVSRLAGAMRNRSTEIEPKRNEAAEYADHLKWHATREQWAVYFDELADELCDPPKDWNTKKNRQIYRTMANIMRKIADACRSADSPSRLKAVLAGCKKYRESAEGYVQEWEEAEEEYEEEDEETVEAEIVDEDERPSFGSAFASLLPALRSRSEVMAVPAFTKHLANATTLRVKYGLYTTPCELCTKENRRVNGVNWPEGAYHVDIVEPNVIRNTERLCHACAVKRHAEIESGRKDGTIGYGNIHPYLDVAPNPYATYCALCITPKQAEWLVRQTGSHPKFRDLDRLSVCDGHRTPVFEVCREYELPMRFEPIERRFAYRDASS